MEKRKLLIAGLGNPGKKYEKTRHNIGFRIIDAFCQSHGGSFHTGKKIHTAVLNRDHFNVHLIKPQQFMNLSGGPIHQYMRSEGIGVDDLLAIHDEIDFVFARLQLKKSGGHAGHNGLRDMIEKIGSKDFSRIRVGVGKPQTKDDVADYVLSGFHSSEEKQMMEITNRAIELIDQWIQW